MDLREAIEFSGYAGRIRAAKPELFASVVESIDTAFAWPADAALAEPRNAADLASQLRELRQRIMLRTLLRDLTCRANLAEVLENREWLWRVIPFPHVVARNVFRPDFYASLCGEMQNLLRLGLSETPARGRLSRGG